MIALFAVARYFEQFQQLIGAVHNAVMLQLWLSGRGHYIALVTYVTGWQHYISNPLPA